MRSRNKVSNKTLKSPCTRRTHTMPEVTKLLQRDLIEWYVCLNVGQANDPKTNSEQIHL